MSYANIEAAQQTLLRALATFSDDEVTRGDFKVLDLGKTVCCVLVPGPFSKRPRGGARDSTVLWTTFVFVFQRSGDDPAAALVSFQTTRQAVIDMYGAYPTLNHCGVGTFETVELAVLEDGDEIMEIGSDADQDSGPFFYLQILRVVITERVAASGGEYT